MMVKSLIDMSRSNLLYSAGVGLIMLVSLVVSNVPSLAFSQYFDFEHRDRLCAALFLLGALFGALAIHRQMLRVKMPWRVPQSQVAIPYAVFFAISLLAVVIAR
jgi:hypothetical protein